MLLLPLTGPLPLRVLPAEPTLQEERLAEQLAGRQGSLQSRDPRTAGHLSRLQHDVHGAGHLGPQVEPQLQRLHHDAHFIFDRHPL